VTILIVLLLTGFSAVGMGLLMSAAVRTQDQATSFIPLVLVPQLFFGGSIAPIATMSAPLAARLAPRGYDPDRCAVHPSPSASPTAPSPSPSPTSASPSDTTAPDPSGS